MKITELTIKERKLANLYKTCKNNEYNADFGIYAQFFLEEYIKFVKIDDMYKVTNNMKIIEELYFTSPRVSLEEICYRCYIEERTLYRYRNKYIKIFDIIVLFHSKGDLVDNNCPINVDLLVL